MVSKKRMMSIARYDATHTKRLSLKLNLKTDKDILDKLDSVSSKQGYVKKLIRDDLAKNG